MIAFFINVTSTLFCESSIFCWMCIKLSLMILPENKVVDIHVNNGVQNNDEHTMALLSLGNVVVWLCQTWGNGDGSSSQLSSSWSISLLSFLTSLVIPPIQYLLFQCALILLQLYHFFLCVIFFHINHFIQYLLALDIVLFILILSLTLLFWSLDCCGFPSSFSCSLDGRWSCHILLHLN